MRYIYNHIQHAYDWYTKLIKLRHLMMMTKEKVYWKGLNRKRENQSQNSKLWFNLKPWGTSFGQAAQNLTIYSIIVICHRIDFGLGTTVMLYVLNDCKLLFSENSLYLSLYYSKYNIYYFHIFSPSWFIKGFIFHQTDS